MELLFPSPGQAQTGTAARENLQHRLPPKTDAESCGQLWTPGPTEGRCLCTLSITLNFLRLQTTTDKSCLPGRHTFQTARTAHAALFIKTHILLPASIPTQDLN